MWNKHCPVYVSSHGTFEVEIFICLFLVLNLWFIYFFKFYHLYSFFVVRKRQICLCFCNYHKITYDKDILMNRLQGTYL